MRKKLNLQVIEGRDFCIRNKKKNKLYPTDVNSKFIHKTAITIAQNFNKFELFVKWYLLNLTHSHLNLVFEGFCWNTKLVNNLFNDLFL